MPQTTLVWFRQDLRLADNAALVAAAQAGAVVPLYILDDASAGAWPMGGASRWWLHGSLAAMDGALQAIGSRLVLRCGPVTEQLPRLVEETGASAVHWNACSEPYASARDATLALQLQRNGIQVQSFTGGLLFEPGAIRTRNSGPFRAFTPFWRACLAHEPPPPIAAPRALTAPAAWPASDRLEAWRLRPRRPDWASGLAQAWTQGEAAARERLADFIDTALADYAHHRDRPASPATSRLSPHLHFGEIGPRQVWHAVRHAAAAQPALAGSAEKFLSELGWREFSHALLHQFEHLPERSLRADFDRFPWRPDAGLLRAWQRGRTGYPIVDAGMRELWHTGWMHNRVRMIAASFLVKHLLQPWQQGARWFWDTLVDADLANNSASWQWVAGSGADAAPFFRIFNPVLQGRRFDAEGRYVRRWLPELARLPDAAIHSPWKASTADLAAAGVTLGKTYPAPVVAHDEARRRALAAFASIGKRAA